MNKSINQIPHSIDHWTQWATFSS